MKPEDVFITELKSYFTEVSFRDIDEVKIRQFLGNYSSLISKQEIVVYKEKVVEKIVYKKISRDREAPSLDKLDFLAQDICNKQGVPFEDFKSNHKRRCTDKVKRARESFCWSAISTFSINQNWLADYFKLNHTAIVYYMRGKKFRIKTKKDVPQSSKTG